VIRWLHARVRSRAPLAIAGFFAVPVFFASLMAASLAADHPHIVLGKEHPSASGREAVVWGLALIAPAILVAIGALALALGRAGVYVALAASLAFCLLLPIRLDAWSARHERRFPLGMDYLKDSDPSNTSSRGEWEHAARDTVLSITHWTIVLIAVSTLVALFVHLRRRKAAPVGPPPEVVGVPDTTPPSLTRSNL
jgi:hypothetical protein